MTDVAFPTADALLLVERALDEDLSTGTDVSFMNPARFLPPGTEVDSLPAGGTAASAASREA